MEIDLGTRLNIAQIVFGLAVICFLLFSVAFKKFPSSKENKK